MAIWALEISLETLTQRVNMTLVDWLGIEFTEIGEDFLSARMPVDRRTRQPLGIMHGGASCALAETAGSTAANCCVDPSAFYCVGLEININHIRSVREGFVTGTAKPHHIGKSTHVWGIEIVDEAHRTVSVSRLTMAVLAKARE